MDDTVGGMPRHDIQLPEPWLHVEFVGNDEFENLERLAGAKIEDKELDNDADRHRDEHGSRPKSRRAWLYSGAKWARIRNTTSGREVLLRLQTLGENEPMNVSAVIMPFTARSIELSGADLRSLPLAAIAGAYTFSEQSGSANLRTFLEVSGEASDGVNPLVALPPASKSDHFSALVARQYQYLMREDPQAYVAGAMSEINGKPLATVQRWITQARKAGFLPPVRTGRRLKG
ncbi:hypothetical protein ACRB8A_14320 [Arthrobacter sp. G.S.26]|uniref:hypothetical protein n=1 Tax=Arthrobacter sp. G.S.26 TaxID=3433706 RepID=UPI003D76FA0C